TIRMIFSRSISELSRALPRVRGASMTVEHGGRTSELSRDTSASAWHFCDVVMSEPIEFTCRSFHWRHTVPDSVRVGANELHSEGRDRALTKNRRSEYAASRLELLARSVGLGFLRGGFKQSMLPRL